MSELDCDAVIVGSGPSGSTVADLLTAHGWSVVVLEKGANHLIELEAPFGPLGHSANDELKSLHRHLLGPDPLVEPRTFRRSEDDGDHLFVGHVNSLPSTVGGGGFHADGKLPRFREDDFRLRTALGPVDGRRRRRLAARPTTTSSRTTRRPSGWSAWPARRRTRSRRGGPARSRCRPAPTCRAPSCRWPPPSGPASTPTAARPA